MRRSTRRQFLWDAAAAGMFVAAGAVRGASTSLRLGTFAFDVSPPLGHSLCGGWIKPTEAYDDPLEAIGFVLLGVGQPIVVCAVDWTGILNEAHVAWREALAKAAKTEPDRVAVQSVHQHNAPFACLGAQRIVSGYPELPPIVDVGFFEQCLEKARHAVQEAVETAQPLTHVAVGQARVEKVASNRRIVDEQGHLVFWRGSSSKDPRAAELPEGLIDPYLRTVAFYSCERKLLCCHYYATHPMSYYGDGRVSSDFVGLARKRRQADDPTCRHVYFTGCAGNVAAGKYNDGTPQARQALTERVYAAMRESEENLVPKPISQIRWTTKLLLPPARSSLQEEQLLQQIGQAGRPVVERNRPSYMVAWLRRLSAKIPIVLSALHVDDVSILHLPAESFIEYQLYAQEVAAKRFVAVAAYGDGGPWYIPTQEAYPQGGYEVSVAFCDPPVDPMLREGIRALLES